MTDKLIRIKADKHARLKKQAQANKRTVPQELDLLLEREFPPHKYMHPGEREYLRRKEQSNANDPS